jgi:hypothetical protein
MMSHDPRRFSRAYLSRLLWLVDYGTPGDLAAFPPSIRTWVREMRACLLVRYASTPLTGDLLAFLRRERNPLL